MNTENKSYKDGNSKNNNDCQRSVCKSKNNPEFCEYLKSQPTPEWIKLIKPNVKTTEDSPKTACMCAKTVPKNASKCKNLQNPEVNNVLKCNNITPKIINNENNNSSHRSECKSKDNPEICYYLKSQPTPEWIKSIKQNVKTKTDSSSKTVKCPNEIKSTSQQAKPVINNVQNCKSFQKSTTESSSAVNKDVTGKSSCPCKGLGKFHDSRYKKNDTKPSDRSAGWGLADWNLGNKKKEEMPKGQITALTSCKKDQTPTTDNVSKCKNIQKPVKCPSTTCMNENRKNELSKVVQKPEQLSTCKNVQKPAIGCPSAACKENARSNCPNKNPGISHNTDPSHNKLQKQVADSSCGCTCHSGSKV
ncbi:Hypothetical protein CINCED_3A013605 [Cinara cedri]|uniref:Uncharacterized protein n=1 Tax=Cinara cedri TaxID=506608 RepID=A0A5E4MH46_9HEMI|nr:Hypothetical protein CINCED_3A013605 [Cinara cedri]